MVVCEWTGPAARTDDDDAAGKEGGGGGGGGGRVDVLVDVRTGADYVVVPPVGNTFSER